MPALFLPRVGVWTGREQQFWTQSFYPRTSGDSSEVSAFIEFILTSNSSFSLRVDQNIDSLAISHRKQEVHIVSFETPYCLLLLNRSKLNELLNKSSDSMILYK